MKLALVHDYLNQYGGAERVLKSFIELFPQAPIFTILYDEKSTFGAFAKSRIKTSFLQKIPGVCRGHRYFLWLMPLSIEQFDLRDFDVVLSDSASFAKGVITRPETLHICYCHTPLRYVWDETPTYLREYKLPRIFKPFVLPLISYLRLWDKEASLRPDYLIANSQFIARKIKKYYRRKTEVIYPPVQTEKFKSFALVNQQTKVNKTNNQGYFLIVSRLLPYKKIDLAIEAFNRLGYKLKIIGQGPQKKILKSKARDNIEFLGAVSHDKLPQYYAEAQGFIFPQKEDFGISACEAMATGKPVIAYKAGGALETVIEGKTGIFFNKQTPESLIAAIKKFEKQKFNSQLIQKHAAQFDNEIFKQKIKAFIEKAWSDFQAQKKL